MSVLANVIVKEVPVSQINALLRQKDVDLKSPQFAAIGGICGGGCGGAIGFICGFFCIALSPFGVVDQAGILGLTKKDLMEARANMGQLRKEISAELQVVAKDIASIR